MNLTIPIIISQSLAVLTTIAVMFGPSNFSIKEGAIIIAISLIPRILLYIIETQSNNSKVKKE